MNELETEIINNIIQTNIIISKLSCPCCGKPLTENDEAFSGVMANRKAWLRANIITVTEQINSLGLSKKNGDKVAILLSSLKTSLQDMKEELVDLEM